MSDTQNDKDGSTGKDATETRKRDQADIPVGNSPDKPMWPVFVTGGLWVCWIVFLAYLAMDVSKHR